jgi:hypothetical protein
MEQRTLQPGIPAHVHDDGALSGISNFTVLYKYFSCETFYRFIDTPEFKFADPTKWHDRFEGHRHNFFQKAYSKDYQAEAKNYRAICWSLGGDDLICYGNDTAKHQAAVDELHTFGHAAMWGSYCVNGGARIMTTYGKLKELLNHLPPGRLWAGRVRYEPESLWMSLPGKIGLVGQLFVKGVAFRHETEFRVLFLPDEIGGPDEVYLPIADPHGFIDEFLIAPESANSPWGTRNLYIDCVNKFSTPIPGPRNKKDGKSHCRISQLYGNVSGMF